MLLLPGRYFSPYTGEPYQHQTPKLLQLQTEDGELRGPMYRVNLIGCGNLGRSLCKLWIARKAISVGEVLTRSYTSAQQAVDAIGQGTAINSVSQMREADIYFFACPDDALTPLAKSLSTQLAFGENAIAFHCSGAHSAASLSALHALGMHLGSVHPVRSFSEPLNSIEQFSGTYCGIEGQPLALKTLRLLFTSINAQLFSIDPSKKELYHAGTVFACNFLHALFATAQQCYQEAGIEEEKALEIIEPMVRNTVEKIFTAKSTTTTLTGPIERADKQTVSLHLHALENLDATAAQAYRLLSQNLLLLTQQKKEIDPPTLNELRALLAPTQ